jgi:hypothetical protein
MDNYIEMMVQLLYIQRVLRFGIKMDNVIEKMALQLNMQMEINSGIKIIKDID